MACHDGGRAEAMWVVSSPKRFLRQRLILFSADLETTTDEGCKRLDFRFVY